MDKSFYNFDTMSNYCQTYQKKYNKIVSRLINNNKGHNKEKYLEVLLWDAILQKFSKVYILLVIIMDIEYTSYTSVKF